MGKDLWQSSAAARRIFEQADLTLGYAISSLCFEGPEDRLRDTTFAQPALLTTSLASLAAALESGAIQQRPALMAGHSLGQYTALVAAGAMTLEDGLKLVQERARLMAEAAAANPGSMAAIIGLDESVVREICEQTGAEVCNLNLPNQTVIGGRTGAIEQAVSLAKDKGAQRALALNVSGAFHSSLMNSAVEGLKAAVAATSITAPEIPVVGNASSLMMTTEAQVREDLGTQIARPVRWHESVTLMANAGVQSFVEFGPGKILTGMARRLVSGAETRNIGTAADLNPHQDKVVSGRA